MVFRVDPAMPVGSYKTYRIVSPKTEQTRIATCQAAGCPNFEHGWRTTVPMLSGQADYIRNRSGRSFTEMVENGSSTFTFHPGQQCFQQHHVEDRPSTFLVRDGDWRGNPSRQQRLHSKAEHWVEDFAEHQIKLKEQLEKG